jgi:hypothetical protein
MNNVSIVVDAVWKGAPAIQKAQADVGKLERDAKGGAAGIGSSFKSAAIGIGAVVGVLGAAALAGRQLYATLREGAQLQTIKQRFDKLSESIGTTADAMLGKLRTATKGMIDDMSLMSSASQIISLRLADNESQVTRLATVVGTLGWDMQQVILTFANMSTMRLDALGLSVEEVKNKAAELEKQGYSTAEAFKEAVILAGEARLEVGGVSDAEQSFKQAEAAIKNYKDSLLLSVTATLDQAGAFDALGAAAARLNFGTTLAAQMDELHAKGVLTDMQLLELQSTMRYGGAEAAAALLESMGKTKAGLEGVDRALLYSETAWQGWAQGISVAAQVAANEVVGASTEMFRALIQVGQLDWMGGQFGEDWQSPVNPDPQRDNRLRAWALREQARGRRSGPFSNIGEETANARVYAGAVDMATEAEMALAAAHGRLASAFSAEVMAKPEEGLIDAAGVVNMENANKALYEQAQAAGATAAQLAMLGVATGQFTEEQAQAALKAAILQERIKQIAAGVASGELSYSDAAGGLASFGEALNAGAIGDAAGGIEALSTAATDFANSSYEAELSVEDQAALTAINDVAAALGGITGTHYIHLVTTTNDGTPSTDAPGRIGVERNAYTVDTRQSGFVGGGGATRMLEWQGDGGGSGAADNRTAYNVTVNNYIDGQKTSNRQLEDITTDKLRAALNSLGVRR